MFLAMFIGLFFVQSAIGLTAAGLLYRSEKRRFELEMALYERDGEVQLLSETLLDREPDDYQLLPPPEFR